MPDCISTNLTGCQVAFLMINTNGPIPPEVFKAVDAIRARGVGNVVILKNIKEAAVVFSKIQQRNNFIPPEKKMLKLTKKGEVVDLFINSSK